MHNIITMLTFLLFCNVAISAEFKIFDGTLYKNKENLALYDIEDLKVIYESEIFDDKESTKMPSREKIRNIANRYAQYEWLVFDIERWDVNKGILTNTHLYINFIEIFKEYNSTTKVGYYGVIPIRDYWRASKKKGGNKYNEWVMENKRLEELANIVDAIFPSVYTFYHDQIGWGVFAEAQIIMAKKISNNKPVYPFIWPQYHDSNKLFSNTYIGNEYWHFQISKIKEHADGVVIWGGWDSDNWRPATWNEDAPWWIVLKEFINNKNVVKK